MNKKLNEADEKQWSNISRNAVLAYIDGATSDAAKEHWYAQWQAEQKQVSAGVWVKASERLPEKSGMYIYKNKGGAGQTCFVVPRTPINEHWESLNIIEWLDESAQQKQVPTDEEIYKLAEKEYPIENGLTDVFEPERIAFIKGFKSALKL